ncbi:5'-nucleotidase domain-containing protein 4 [Selaginella moellendorffii]|uniref:5'-nucleotidase domain-containing protein 4 n=1 Tax=Selaginella moellendorffii TaxID=88036 RepID=UPI000D1C4B7E|nr:5'-nucleotidase domain-containing protein 4 [Selaginella moellendorffii]|eukprot:XP_024525082.1 5'-nucleotidase domain-containing protein 4 [Selaginella moellendorffii]
MALPKFKRPDLGVTVSPVPNGDLDWELSPFPREPLNSPSCYLAEEHPLTWASSKWNGVVDSSKHIFCNRSLNMKSIVAVGFDMDYTLAQYKPDTFEVLAYQGTVKKLVYNLGYPTDLLQWTFDWKYMIRGLVLDKRRGNVLKMDRHKYVKVAYHGFRELPREERMATYGNTLSREAYDEPDYALIDTLFSLAEAYLFAQLVEYRDSSPSKLPAKDIHSEDGMLVPSYAQIYKDVRSAVDLCHRDGTLKQAVSLDPGKYIHEDPLLVPMFKMLRDSGRMTFLVTNSLWDYTHVVMNYLCGKTGNEGVPRDDEWLSYFDLVITGSAKPAFFADSNRAPLFEVDIETGMLQNTDNGTPLMQVGGLGVGLETQKKKNSQHCRAFQGGGVAHLHKLLAIEAGAQVLYVGDHIYGDILRSKKQLGWRTMLVIPELESELELLKQNLKLQKEFRKFRRKREELEDLLQRAKWKLRLEHQNEEELLTRAKSLQQDRDSIRDLQRQTHKDLHQKFHSVWGQLMKTGYQNSRFAHQVERFACLYTSQVTNLCYYSPDKSFRTTEDFMPHELEFAEF